MTLSKNSINVPLIYSMKEEEEKEEEEEGGDRRRGGEKEKQKIEASVNEDPNY